MEFADCINRIEMKALRSYLNDASTNSSSEEDELPSSYCKVEPEIDIKNIGAKNITESMLQYDGGDHEFRPEPKKRSKHRK